jgi:hypothetical protein
MRGIQLHDLYGPNWGAELIQCAMVPIKVAWFTLLASGACAYAMCKGP